MTPALRDALWSVLVFASYLVGIATTLVYVVRMRLVVIRSRQPQPAVYRSEMPTLTGLQVDKAVGELARKCRQDRQP
jgi:hypothetical protein